MPHMTRSQVEELKASGRWKYIQAAKQRKAGANDPNHETVAALIERVLREGPYLPPAPRPPQAHPLMPDQSTLTSESVQLTADSKCQKKGCRFKLKEGEWGVRNRASGKVYCGRHALWGIHGEERVDALVAQWKAEHADTDGTSSPGGSKATRTPSTESRRISTALVAARLG